MQKGGLELGPDNGFFHRTRQSQGGVEWVLYFQECIDNSLEMGRDDAFFVYIRKSQGGFDIEDGMRMYQDMWKDGFKVYMMFWKP